GGDIEENHFVRALLVVTQRQSDRVADIAQFARFGLAELHAASHLAVVNVQARYDTFCHHCGRLNRFAGWEATVECIRTVKRIAETIALRNSCGEHESLCGQPPFCP